MIEQDYIELNECLACGGHNLEPLLDLEDQPLANSYTKTKDEILPTFPLKTNVCKDCYHVQLSVAVNPDLMFKDYLYVSGTSKTLRDYFDWFAKFSVEYHRMMFSDSYLYSNMKSGLKVLDIGCNDGSQLDSYKKLGCETHGIDPAENLYEISSKKHDVICGYFDCVSVRPLATFNIINAQNVFAHNYDPISFLRNVYDIMSENSILFIQTSQADMILNNEYDTIYHEHISFYNIKSMDALCRRAGLYLIDVIKTPIHGTSYTFVISTTDDRPSNIINLIEMEEKAGLYDMATYDKYRSVCLDSKFKIRDRIAHYKSFGYIIIGYGAAAKGNTLLNFTKANLDYIIDDNPMKQGLYTPGSHVKIVPKEFLNTFDETDKIFFVPLAWNFFNEIKANIKSVRDNRHDFFMRYFPTIEIS